MSAPDVRETARAAYAAGLSIVPPREDGSKQPDGAWKHHQTTLPTPEQMRAWYVTGNRAGVGIVCGAVSGNVECFEFDDRETYRAFIDAARHHDLAELVNRIACGYEETTPGEGVHWLYRCDEIAGNTKLASRPGAPDDAGRLTVETLIETRGEGGYVIIAPTNGRVHPSGGAYRLRRGDVSSIATITPAERRELHRLARTFDQMPVREYRPPSDRTPRDPDELRPGEDFNRRADWRRDVLDPAGWAFVCQRGDVSYWRRPGKERGVSATVNYAGADLFICFSTSTLFEPEQGYSKWRVYAILHHGGDFPAAARALAAQGYGTPRDDGARLIVETRPDDTPQHSPRPPQPQTPATEAIPAGCTLAQYAEAKKLPPGELSRYGLTQIVYQGAPAVRMPYRAPDGSDDAVQFRIQLHKTPEGDDRFKWRAGSKTCLYGLWRMELARDAGSVVLVEGASDCHTLWHHNIPALGLPGASNYNDARDAAHFDGIPTIYVVIEPDKGGETVKGWLSSASIRERVHLLDLDGYKDPSDVHVADPDRFTERWQAAIARAVPWTRHVAEQADTERRDAWEQCKELAGNPAILDTFANSLTATGYAGSTDAPKLLYLVLTSRRLDRPVSAVVKGPSSGGKSHSVERTLDYFPETAYYALSGMSERALAYGDEPLSHRMLVIYEAAGMAGEYQSYLLRSLLSEGRIRYETVEKTSDGMRPRLIEREGPTGVILTTTAVKLHPENETRLLSIPVADTREQTRLVLLALASDTGEPVDLAPWRALQTWLDHADNRVTIPYATALAAAVPPVAVRLRRDFGAVLNLIRAHAVLQQARRERDDAGRIIATIGDYAVVRALVMDLVSEGVEARVSATIRETVAAVAALTASDDATASITQIAKELKLDKGAASRRVAAARDAGYLVNLEDKKGKPARLVIGADLPDDLDILPDPGRLSGGEGVPIPRNNTATLQHSPETASGRQNSVDGAAECCNNTRPQPTPAATPLPRLHAETTECCSVAAVSEGVTTPSPPLAVSVVNTDPSRCPCGTPLYESQPGGLCRTCRERNAA